jgi:large subunit ribosomal protein L32
MGVPKRRKSRSRKKMRVRSHRHPMPSLAKCPKCHAWTQPHRACPSCGYYGDRQVISITAE